MQCSNCEDAFRAVADFNERLISMQSATHSQEISVDDLKQDCHAENTATCIARLADEWQQLDDIYVRQQHKVQGTGKRSSLVVPFDVKQSQITGDVLNTVSDERVSDVVKVEYFSKLHKLLQSATQARSASDMAETGAENTALNTVQNASSSLKRDVLCIPELAAAFAKQKKQHVLSQPEWGDRERTLKDGDLIITVTVYTPDCKLNYPKQIIDVLGCQSVQELCSAIYCVHCALPASPPGIQSSSLVRSSRHEDSFCCVEGDIYTDLCRDASIRNSTSSCCCFSSSATSSRTTAVNNAPNTTSENAARMLGWLNRTVSCTPHTSANIGGTGVEGASAAADEAETVLMLPASSSTVRAQVQVQYTGAKRGRRKAVSAPATVLDPPSALSTARNLNESSTTTAADTTTTQPTTETSCSSSSAPPVEGVEISHSQQISADAVDPVPQGDAQFAKRGRKKAAKSNTPSHTDNKEFRIRLPSGENGFHIMCSKNVRCDSINWQLGTPYLYAHNGCDHIFYVSNIRLYHAQHDSSSVAAYPVETFRAKYKQRKCMACEVLTAQYVVYGDRLAECSPCFYCAHCYHMLHYSADGQLLYDDFQVFPYVHDP